MRAKLRNFISSCLRFLFNEDIKELIQGFQVKAYFFLASQVEIEYLIEGDAFDEKGKLDPSRMKSYFVFRPIKILTAPESEFTEESSD